MKQTHLRTYISMWMGQSLSALGSSIFGFALSFYIYSKTQRADYLGYFAFAQLAPGVYFSLFLGPLIDRFNKRRLLIVSDVAQLVFSLAMIPFLLADNILGSIMPLLALSFASSLFSALQNLTFVSSVRLFTTNDRLHFFNGLTQIFRSVPLVIGPLLSLPLLNLLGLRGIILIDILSFSVAFINMLLIRFPEVNLSQRPALSLSRLRAGWDTIRASKALSTSLSFFAWNNFMAGLGSSFVLVLLIDASHGNHWIISASSSMGALGGVLGGVLLVSVSKYLSKPFLVFALTIVLASMIGRVGYSLISAPLIMGLFFFLRTAILPVMNGANDTIWQSLVSVENQGCAFATRRLIAQGLYPIGLLLGPILVTKFNSTGSFMIFVGIGELLSAGLLVSPRLRSFRVPGPVSGHAVP